MRTTQKWMTRGALASAAAALLTTAVAVQPAAAHKSDDWRPGYDLSKYPHGYKPYSAVEPGGAVVASLYWNDKGKHAYSITVGDTLVDGHSAVAQIRYSVYYEKKWHTHYRYAGKVTTGAGTTNTVDATSRRPIRDLHVRVCLMEKKRVVQCDSEFR